MTPESRDGSRSEAGAVAPGRAGLAAALASDIPASFVVFLVAVPLALGIALASGAPLMAGLIGCIVGGIVAGSLAGAPLQVSGPAAGLTVIVFGLIQKYDWPTMCAITAAAGLIQIILGFSRIARACLAISPAVVHGMLAGIGVVITLAQIHVLLGGSPQSSALQNIVALPSQIAALFGSAAPARVHATIVGLVTVALLFAWQRVPKKLQMVPGALVAVLAGTLLANLIFTAAPRVSLPDEPLFQFRMPTLPADIGGFVVAALSIALVASVESLLCAVATDRLHTGPRANLDKELVAQGAANSVSGLIGGLPVTGVIVRSTANISSGGKTRMSAVLHAVWILLFMLLASSHLERIPLAALAGLLVFVGVRLVNVHHMRDLVTHREVIVYEVTLFGVAFVNLLAGVALGIGLALILLLRRMAHVDITVGEQENRWNIRLEGSMTFLSVPKLTEALSRIPKGAAVEVDLMVDFMDHAAFEALHGWRQNHERAGGSVDIDERHEPVYTLAVRGKPIKKRGSGPPPSGDVSPAEALA